MVTPLTSRVYRSLCAAASLHYAGAVTGPSGVGKSETVRELALALAKVYVPMACSGNDASAVTRLLRGAASSGAWLCLEEFHRFPPGVIDVAAQQMLAIQQAAIRGLQHFDLEGVGMKLRYGGLIVVVTPGAEHQARLPESLKALLRPVAMVAPELHAVAEVKLLAHGFKEALLLARRVAALFRLCGELLPARPHYDFGLRAVLAAVAAAGRLQRASPEEDEAAVVLQAIIL